MLADTSFTMKSGPMGTSMFSRSGKVTNYQYVCFSNGHPEPEKEVVESEEQKMINEMAMQTGEIGRKTNLDYLSKPPALDKSKKK
jgi:hypothetical protein